MGIGRLSVVADTGPILHLAEVGCLELLDVFDRIHIPEAVSQELDRQGQAFHSEIAALSAIQQHVPLQNAVLQFVSANHLEDLHFGERECLYLCQALNIPVILTDDLAVRDAAKCLRFTPVGSLGVIVRAYHRGRLSLVEAEHHLTELHDGSSLFVTSAIVDMAIQQLHKRTR
jgi:predicted nucleic acid-binding protein